ncbi:MAG: hypothetical protein QOC81_1921, partial [Thermoanaerobaculia bacterium]|nr:hypothetical protein [Thermoanaerobaculia bacterium]
MSIRRIAAVLILLLVSVAGFAQTTTSPKATRDLDCDDANDAKDSRCNDPRDSLLADFYLGEAVDNFAGDETLGYLNPQDANKNLLRAIGGVDFQYRLAGKRSDDRQLWVYGQTVYGVRSKDVDCKDPNTV